MYYGKGSSDQNDGVISRRGGKVIEGWLCMGAAMELRSRIDKSTEVRTPFQLCPTPPKVCLTSTFLLIKAQECANLRRLGIQPGCSLLNPTVCCTIMQ